MTPIPLAIDAGATAIRSRLSPLTRYALDGLRHCWMPERNRFSFSYRFDSGPGTSGHNVSRPKSDTYYSLNVLLGLSRVPSAAWPPGADETLYQDCCRELAGDDFVPYAYGMALWTGAAIRCMPPVALTDRIRQKILTPSSFAAFSAQDIGLLTSGATAMALMGETGWRDIAERLAARLRDRYCNVETGLFYNHGCGLRANFSSFASQVYPLLALYQYGEAFDAADAILHANRCAERLIRRQGPQGEWPWFYHVAQGRVVDFYEVYSVHQHGMAPAFLHHAVAHGVAAARESLVRGFNWLFGRNQLAAPMLYRPASLFFRSQLRSGEYHSTLPRIGRSIGNALLRRDDRVETSARRLVLRRECRSYELGWILWSFANRNDYPELTERAEFAP